MARPTAKAGIALLQKIVVIPAEIIAKFAIASFLADKKAASNKLFAEPRNFASKKAQVKLTIKAPVPTAVNEVASGADGLLIS
jgi:hypothetical protein